MSLKTSFKIPILTPNHQLKCSKNVVNKTVFHEYKKCSDWYDTRLRLTLQNEENSLLIRNLPYLKISYLTFAYILFFSQCLNYTHTHEIGIRMSDNCFTVQFQPKIEASIMNMQNPAQKLESRDNEHKERKKNSLLAPISIRKGAPCTNKCWEIIQIAVIFYFRIILIWIRIL